MKKESNSYQKLRKLKRVDTLCKNQKRSIEIRNDSLVHFIDEEEEKGSVVACV